MLWRDLHTEPGVPVRITLSSTFAIALFTAACTPPTPPPPAPDIGEQAAALTADQCIYFDANGKDLICHATGSAKNPFVLIKVSENACIQAHSQHSGDYISVNDPTCSGHGCLPLNAPCDPL